MTSSTERRRYTLTLTPVTRAQLDDIIDVLRAKLGRGPLIHVVGDQPGSTHLEATRLTKLESRAGESAPMAGYLRNLAKQAERDYANAVIAAHRASSVAEASEADYWRWSGQAEAHRAIATTLRQAAGDKVPDYGGTAWREDHGIVPGVTVPSFGTRKAAGA